jgi:iron complex outermembrane recepter protein
LNDYNDEGELKMLPTKRISYFRSLQLLIVASGISGTVVVQTAGASTATVPDSASATTAGASAPPSAAPTEGGQNESVSTGGSDSLAEILVTAEKREQRLQDVPVSVVAVTADQLEARVLTSTPDLTLAVPGLAFMKTVTYGNFYLRGVGSNLFGPNTEQPVALFIDGVYISSAEANTFSFNNISQIDVLKGPQGTLFGRNTTGGVVQITTRDPKQEPGVEVNVGYANYDTETVSIYATTGLTRNIAVDLAAIYADQGDGYGHDFTTGAQTFIQARNNYAVRSKLLWDVNDNTTVRIGADYSRSFNSDAYQIPQGVIGPDHVTTYAGPYNAFGNVNDFLSVDGGGGSIQIDHDFGPVRIVSISADRFTNVRNVIDQDQTPEVIVQDSFPSRSDDFTEEVRVQNGLGSRVNWVIGGFYYDAYAAYIPADINSAGTNLIIGDFQKTNSKAAFGETTVPIGETTNLTGGVRYTTETQHFGVTNYTYGGVPSAFPDAEQSFSKVTWRGAIDHHFTQDLMAYASANSGFKTGGFNLFSPTDPPYKPETLDAYEIGAKSDWFERHLRVNAAAFLYNYTNIQAQIPFAGSNRVVNGPEARIQGLELESQAVPLQTWRVSESVSLLDSKYLKYPDALYVFPEGGFTTINAAGNRLPNTPKATATLTLEHDIRTSAGLITPSITEYYSTSYFAFPDNRLQQPPYALLNASIGWASVDDHYSVKLWGKNLTDRTYYESLTENTGLGDVQRQAAPRTYGVTFGAKF